MRRACMHPRFLQLCSASILSTRPWPVVQSRFAIVRRRCVATLPRLPIFNAISKHDPESIAVVHSASGRHFKYGQLLNDVAQARDSLVRRAQERHGRNGHGRTAAFLIENSHDYVVTWLAILAAGWTAVPLAPSFPTSELEYVLRHSEASTLVSSERFSSKAEEVISALQADHAVSHMTLERNGRVSGTSLKPTVLEEQYTPNPGASLMLYTSGTTNRPKGVIIPEPALNAQAQSLIQAWMYSPSDHLLHVLPLHHIHGVINGIFAPLFAGSTIEFLYPFNADIVWRRFAAPFLAPANASGLPKPVTLFTAVPTIYSRLQSTFSDLPSEIQRAARTAISPQYLRLAISGSAALPTPIKQAWSDLSNGNTLLERFGMTEVGMALSCGLDSHADRIDGSVGWPMPGVEARLKDVDTGSIIKHGEELDPSTGKERVGEIQVRGPGVFSGYKYNEFVDTKDPNMGAYDDGTSSPTDKPSQRWFRTGDVAIRHAHPNPSNTAFPEARHGKPYFILGRESADIIKFGGEKVSALEVERELLSLPNVAEAAVVAVPSAKWGHKVGAVIVLHRDAKVVAAGEGFTNADGKDHWTPLAMRRALKDKLASYKTPQLLRIVESIPRNAMGKVNKRELVAQLFKGSVDND